MINSITSPEFSPQFIIIILTMSWTGLKKAINRASTQMLLKTGQMEKTVDKEYEFEEKRFKSMESTSLKLHKELKHYLDSLRIVTQSQANIGEALGSFYGTNDQEPANISQEYSSTMKQLGSSIKDLESPYNQTVLNPIARFNSYYIEVNEAIKKRLHKQLDYDSLKNKVRKLIEKPEDKDLGHDSEDKLNEYQEQLVEAQKNFDDLNGQLKHDLPRLINLRIPFLGPSFESFVKIQLRFFMENYEGLVGLQGKLDARSREDFISGRVDKRLDEVLVKMRELNITS